MCYRILSNSIAAIISMRVVFVMTMGIILYVYSMDFVILYVHISEMS